MYLETMQEFKDFDAEHEFRIFIDARMRQNEHTHNMFGRIKEYHRETVGRENFAYTCICSDDGQVEVFLKYKGRVHREYVSMVVQETVTEISGIPASILELMNREGAPEDIQGAGCRCPLL